MSADVIPIQRGRIAFDPKPAAFVMAKDPIVVAQGGIRTGKTHAGAFKSIMYWLEHPTDVDEFHIIGSPTYPMSGAPKDKVFKLLYDKTIFPICPLIRYHKGERVFELATRDGQITRAKVVTMSDPDKLRGFRWLSAWLDEAAYMAPYAWEVAQGRLLDSRGPAWITTTPKGYNWVYELYKKARAGNPEYRFFHWSASEASHLTAKGILSLGQRFDARAAAQELGGLYVRDAGRVYYTFSATEHAVPARLNPSLEVHVGIDFNVNPMSLVVMQPFQTREGLEGEHVIAEQYIDNGDTYQAATWLKNFCEANKIERRKVKLYPDASGRSRHTSGGSDFEVLREAGFRVYAPDQNGPVGDRINVVNGLFKPMMLRYPRLLIDPSCVVLIEALEQQKRDKTGAPDKEHGHDHPVDALGYPLVYRYPLRQQTELAA